MSSQEPLQSSSIRLQVSAGATQAPQAPAAQVSVPVDPQVVVQGWVAPAVQTPEVDEVLVDEVLVDEVLVVPCPPAPPEAAVPVPVPPAPLPPECGPTLDAHAAARATREESAGRRRAIFTERGSRPRLAAVKVAGADE